MVQARKMVTAVCLATLMTATSFSTITPFPQTTITAEAASTISVEQAGKNIAKAQDKAFSSKKDVTVTVKVKCASKKKAENVLNAIEEVTTKTELVDAYNEKAGTIRPSIGVFQSVIGKTVSFKETVMTTTTSLKEGILTYKMTIHGGKSAFQKAYKNNNCLKQNVADLKVRVKGMSEKDKAWEVAMWLNERMCYNARSIDISDEAIYNGKAEGKCGQLATVYLKYALLAGVEKPGYVDCVAENHAWNCVVIDGETYYLDMQDVESFHSDYIVIKENADSTDEKVLKGVELRRQIIKDYNCDLSDPTEVSEGEFGLLTEKQFLNYSDGVGKPSQWKYKWRA